MKLQQYYEAQTSLLRLERRIGEVSEAVKQAKYDLRAAEDELLNYQGGVCSFLDRLSGKQAERSETLRRSVRLAEEKRNALLRERETLNRQQKEQKEYLEALPSLDLLRKDAGEKQWAALEAAYCAEVLSPLLEENHKALLEYRSVLRGEYPILSMERRQEMLAEPNVWAERCVPYLLRLKAALEILGEPFDLGSYYASPAAYLVSVAAKHNRLDRVNRALDQVEEVQKQIREILTC